LTRAEDRAGMRSMTDDDIIPRRPWGIQICETTLLIGSVRADKPDRVDEIVCRLDYEEGVVNRSIELASPSEIIDPLSRKTATSHASGRPRTAGHQSKPLAY
jgi:hypothetical protein